MDEAFMQSVLLFDRRKRKTPTKNKKTHSKTELSFEHYLIITFCHICGKSGTEEKQQPRQNVKSPLWSVACMDALCYNKTS